MKLYAITTCFADPDMIEACTSRSIGTSGLGFEIARWVFVNDHWPLLDERGPERLRSLAVRRMGDLITTPKNIGAHHAWNFALSQLNLADDDLVLNIDQDSWPVQVDWGLALLDVMKANPALGYMSLLDERCVNNRQWKFETIAGHKCAFDIRPEMFNITLYRGRVLKHGGMLATSPFYGGVEAAMWDLGFRSGYLYDFREAPCPIKHPKVYEEWKLAHGQGRNHQSFPEYLQCRIHP